MNRLESASVLLSLTEHLRKEGSWTGETHVQKAAYVLCRVLGVPLDYEFLLYKHGPFSFDLRNELSAMRAEGLMAWEVRPFPYGPSLKEGELGPALKRQFSAVAERYKKQIEFVSKKLGSKDVKALERFATAIYVTRDLNMPQPERAARINELKPHVSIPEAEEAVCEADEFLREADEFLEEAKAAVPKE